MTLAILTPALLQIVQTVLRRAGIHRRSRTPAPVLSLATTTGSSTTRLRVAFPSLILDLHVRACAPVGTFVLDREVLEVCAGPSREPLRFEPANEGFLRAQWSARNTDRQSDFRIVGNAGRPDEPLGNIDYTENDANLWTALRDAVATADQSSPRYATDCIQLRGSSGSIAATDTKQLLIQRGFTFPWPDNRLIPGCAVLGCRELVAASSVGVAQEGNRIWFRNGPWAVAVPLETERRFPEVDRIVPSTGSVQSRLVLSEADRTFLRGELDALCPRKAEQSPVTVELNGHVILRTRSNPEKPSTELTLSNSRLEGTPVTCLLTSHNLRRAIGLGFEQVLIQDAKAPLFCDDGLRQFVWMPLDASQALRASDSDVRITSPTAQSVQAPSVPIRRITSMPLTTTTTATVPAASPRIPVAPTTSVEPEVSSSDPVQRALALCESLRSVAAECHDLIRVLKRQRREARLVKTTLASLRQLQEVA